ncbi:MAG TPA: prevent-host-death protein [Lentisphaeria bacterium]|nr:MAG: hypothetical protein A2X47_08425 [Lentisphaerae bacterium GWF2_38_69]HBM15816.1 prevent-host-death protein [Lentisphaeria bacterium]
MITVNTHEAKTRFSTLLGAVEKDGETILVCRSGHPVAEIHSVLKKAKKGLPKPNKKLAVKLKYNPTEPLDEEDLPQGCL